MVTTWIQPNRRALLMGMILPTMALLGGMWLVAAGHAPWQALGAALAAGGLILDVLLVRQLVRPRVAFGDGELRLYLSGGAPFCVPIDVVECFFLATASAALPIRRGEGTKVSSVVIRLAESAHQWKQRDVKPALGSWRDGYVTIRGTWCEPLTLTAVNRLNEKLRSAQRSKT